MSSSGKIATSSCQIDLGAIEPISNGLDFQTIVPNGHTVYAAVGYWCRQMLMYPLQLILCMLLPKKKKSQSVTQ